ncbi:MAG: UDP-N-acetyl-D-mannosamine dehydrogenase [Methanosaeta sp. PtaB.Bin039]|mgnify:CR=1 FL=1|nr:MAG: UDP-N-acetyl-D-mannosamine dehydrogenase [Methanosaeta sp. PtaB.Bin039]HOT06007.1 nucleotide sugar dehydrogenase [Methanotrichaceae archaeon]HQF16789.1 nucleotide sugar dehydrogenase [Methanotrichaceae archaeon]HQI90115.1 nucleotide sugar dehydrogenase [Methanotrichaceae archaeon]HQJ27862.1 nucleotide sugar dehydrogenase [Methanotrichaceae archaeon]
MVIFTKIAVVGLGNAGLPLAAVIADSGQSVVGVDIDRHRCERINRGENPIPQEAGLDQLLKMHGGQSLLATADFSDAASCTVFIVIVPLFVDDMFNPDFCILESAFRSVGSILKEGDLVVLETTVPPGTTDDKVRSWLQSASGLSSGQFFLAYSPERIMTGYSISRLREFPKVIGGADQESGIAAYQVYRQFIPNLKLVSSARVAEMIKVMEGCYRDVNIALANELYRIAEELGVDFAEARAQANHPYCHIHLPSTGVGGHCIPVYPWFLIREMERRECFDRCRLLRLAREQNDLMIDHWAQRILLECMRVDKPLGQVRICVKGITYRQGVKEFHHSRNLALAHLLAKKGLDARAWDELLSKEEVEAKGLRWMLPEDADIVFDSFELEIRLR